MNLVRGAARAPVKLGKELGRGGEGAVFPVVGAPGLVAKIYFKPLSAAKADKLRAMSRHAAPALLRAAAWPLDVLADEAGVLRGFLMSRIDAREDLHQLYSPKSRRRAFPDVDFRFVARVATNLARAFAQVHAQGNVIGDVNHGNALVGRDGTVVLIDCDSFQVRQGGRTFTCDVGVPLFTPPEISGRAFRGLVRSTNHDAFGLAVLLFHLLFTGRHPFAGRFVDGEMPIERAIAESRFAYGAQAAARGMSAPPGTLPLTAFGEKLASLFEAAFAAPGERARPSASEWVNALQEFEVQLAACDAPQPHWRPGGGPDCCWCEHEKRTGMQVFGRVVANAVSLGALRVARLWDAIVAVPRPQTLAPVELPPPGAYYYAAPDVLGPKTRVYFGLALVVMTLMALGAQPGGTPWSALFYLGSAVACLWPFTRRAMRNDTRQAAEIQARSARAHLKSLVERWNAIAADGGFDEALRRLEEVRQQLIELPGMRNASIRNLAEQAARVQRDRFLSLFRLERAKLLCLTKSNLAMLASHGVDSADDVLRHAAELARLIGKDAARDLEAWANLQAQKFAFDPRSGVGPEDLQEVDRLMRSQQEQYAATLERGEEELRRLAEHIEGRRARVRRDLDQAQATLAAAEEELA